MTGDERLREWVGHMAQRFSAARSPDVEPDPDDASARDSPPGGASAPASPPASPPAAARAQISGSVGRGGKNAKEDVVTVQTLLNDHGASLEADGLVGTKTVRAIGEFQEKNVGFVDGRVDPGGKTWQRLSGSAASANPGASPGPGADPGPGGPGGTPPDPGEDPVRQEQREKQAGVSDDFEESRDTGDGAGFESETEVKTPFGSVKVKLDADGNVVGGSIVAAAPLAVDLGLNIGVFTVGFEVKALEREIEFGGSRPLVQATGKISCGGSGSFGLGVSRGDAKLGLKCIVGLSVATEIFKAQVDLDKLEFDFSGLKLPMRIPLKGEIKGGAGFEVNGVGIGHEITIKEYKDILIAEIAADFSMTLKKGPGLDQIVGDLTKVFDGAVKLIEEHPDITGTGPPPLSSDDFEGAGEQPKKAQSASGDINRIAQEAEQAAGKMEALQTCRQVEATMRSAFQAGWADPTLLGKANALAQKDEAMAREIYGNAWTQRALAKQAYDQYGAPIESNPIEIINARTAQAHDIAQKFQTAVALFRQGDAAW